MVLRPVLVSCNCWTLTCMISPTVEENKPYYTQKKYDHYLQNSSRLRKSAAVLSFSLSERKKQVQVKSRCAWKNPPQSPLQILLPFHPEQKDPLAGSAEAARDFDANQRSLAKLQSSCYFSHRTYHNAPSLLLPAADIYGKHSSLKAKWYSLCRMLFSIVALCFPHNHMKKTGKNRTICTKTSCDRT